MSAQEVKVRFSAVDRLSSAISSINQKLQAIRQPVTETQGRFAKLGAALGGKGTLDALRNAGSAAGDLRSEITGAAMAVAGLGAAIVGPAFALVKSFAQASNDIADTADKIGISTQALQELRYAAKLSGIETEGFDKAMVKLGKSMAEASIGTGEGLAAFQALGIEVKDRVTGRLKSVDQVLPQIADMFAKIGSAGAKNTLAMRIFGQEGANMSLLLSKGSEGIRDLRLEALALGSVIGDKTLKRAGEFNNQLDRVKTAVQGAAFVVAAELLPTFENLSKELLDFLRNNREQIVSFGQSFKTALETVLGVAKSAFKGIMAAVSLFNMQPAWMQTMELYGAMALLGAVIAGSVLISAFNFVTALHGVAAALAPVIARLLIATPLYQSFAYALALGATPLQAVAAGFKGLGVAILGAGKAVLAFFATNPIGWAILAVSAIALLIYKWDEWGETIKRIGAVIAAGVFVWMGPIAWLIGAAAAITANWQSVKEWFVTLWNDPRKAFDQFIGYVLGKLKAVGEWLGVISPKIAAATGAPATTPAGAAAGSNMALAAISGINGTPAKAEVNVNFGNVPRGTTVQTSPSSETPVNLSLGYAGVF